MDSAHILIGTALAIGLVSGTIGFYEGWRVCRQHYNIKKQKIELNPPEFDLLPMDVKRIIDFLVAGYGAHGFTKAKRDLNVWSCGQLSDLLKRMLAAAGHPARICTGTVNGVDHVWVQSGDWHLDPTIRQFKDTDIFCYYQKHPLIDPSKHS